MAAKYLLVLFLICATTVVKAQDGVVTKGDAKNNANANAAPVKEGVNSTLVEVRKAAKREKRAKEARYSLPPSETTEFKSWVLNTNFIVPIVRFNTTKESGISNNQKGNVSFFNSVGAGLSINRAILESTTDKDSVVINNEMNNIIGIQAGLLFAANAGSQNNVNIFAPTLSISILNF